MRAILAVLLLAGCGVDLSLETGTEIQCAGDSECPEGMRCDATTDRCVDATADQPPTLTIGTIDRSIGDLDIPLTVTDSEGQPVTIHLEFVTAVHGGIEDTPVTSIDIADFRSDGVTEDRAWNANLHGLIPTRFYEHVEIRGYASDRVNQGPTVQSARFVYGNVDPVITGFAVGDGVTKVQGLTVVLFTLVDAAEDLLDITDISVASNGNPMDAVPVPLTTGPLGNFTSGALNGLRSSAAGVQHFLTWDSSREAIWTSDETILVMTVTDVFGGTATEVTADFEVENQTPPRAEGVYVKNDGTRSNGAIPIQYNLIDEQWDPADVLVEFSSDGRNWQRCTEHPSIFSSGRYGLQTRPGDHSGMAHTFIWESTSDLPLTTQVQVRITAADFLGGVGEPTIVLTPSLVGPSAPPVGYSKQSAFSGAVPQGVALADMNGDGYDDLVAMSDADLRINVTVDQPFGFGFTTPMVDPTHSGTMLDTPEVDDLDGNGFPDVVFNQNRQLQVLWNEGPMACGDIVCFTGPVGLPVATDVPAMEAADIDGDGAMDLLVTTFGPAEVRVLVGDGSRGFSEHANSPVDVGGVIYEEADTADLDGDGNADFALQSASGVDIYFGRSTGAPLVAGESHTSFEADLAFGDFDGDGVLDVLSGGSRFLRGLGGGAFDPPVTLNVGTVGTWTVGDFDGDGRTDILAGSATNVFRILYSLGSDAGGALTFRPATHSASDVWTYVTTGDIDADGALDAAGIWGFGGEALITDHRTAFEWVPFDSEVLAGGDGRLTAADFTLDGITDFFVGDATNTGVIPGSGISGIADGGFRTDLALTPGLSADNRVAVGDFDGDGLWDLAAGTGCFSNQVAVFLGQAAAGVPTRTFAESGRTGVQGCVYELFAADLNGDGNLDIAAALADRTTATSAGGVSVLLGGGDGTLGSEAFVDLSTDVLSVRADDIDNDGDLDLLAFGGDSDGNGGASADLFVLLNDGPPFPPSLAPSPILIDTNSFGDRDVLVADFNGDGHLDVAARGHDGGSSATVHVRGGDGAGGFPLSLDMRNSGFSIPGPARLLLTDYQGDGAADILVVNPEQVILHPAETIDGVPAGTFSNANVVVDSVPDDVSLGDFNSDGVADLAIISESFDQLSISTGLRLDPGERWRVTLTPWDPMTGAGNVLGTDTLPAGTDRFLLPIEHVLSRRPYRPGADGPGELAVSLRNQAPHQQSMPVSLPNGPLRALTTAWVVTGDERLVQVESNEGPRLKIENRLGPRVDPTSNVDFSRRGLFLSASRAVIVDLPILPGRSTGGNIHVYQRTRDWLRAPDWLDPGTGNPIDPAGSDFLPLLPDPPLSMTYRQLFKPVYQWREITRAPMDDLTQGSTARFAVDESDPHNRRVRILTDELGTFQAFLAP